MNNMGGGQARVCRCCRSEESKRGCFKKYWVGKGRRETSQKPQREGALKRVSMFSISFLLSFVLNKLGGGWITVTPDVFLA